MAIFTKLIMIKYDLYKLPNSCLARISQSKHLPSPSLLFPSLFLKGLRVRECVCVFPAICLNIWVFVSITNSINIHDWFNYHQYIQNITLLECHSNIYHFCRLKYRLITYLHVCCLHEAWAPYLCISRTSCRTCYELRTL